jgi:ABC-2 type transport system ATP-binding protein
VQIINQGRMVFSDSIEGLTQRMQVTTLLINLATPPALEQLQTLPGVQSIEALGDNYFRIHHDQEHTPAQLLVEHSVANGWGLCELTPERMSLEQVFVDLTTNEPHPEKQEAVA